MPNWKSVLGVCAVAFLGVTFTTFSIRRTSADDYFSVDLGRLVAEVNDSQIVSESIVGSGDDGKSDFWKARVIVPGSVEAYLVSETKPGSDFSGVRIVGRKPAGVSGRGRVFAICSRPGKPTESVLAELEFSLEGDAVKPPTAADFHRGKGLHFQRLWARSISGSAMFRHLATKSLAKVSESASGPNLSSRSFEGPDATLALMSGGRAVSENLQLDRQLDLPESTSSAAKPLSEVRGISVREIDWGPLLVDEPTKLDPLAKGVPHNQYAVFFRSFGDLSRLVQRGFELAHPALGWLEPQSVHTDVMGFYQRQLGLPLTELTRPAMPVGEVALTGSDPYFRTGTDLALLIRSSAAEELHQGLTNLVCGQAAEHDGAERTEHQLGESVFVEWSTEDRLLCSFVGRVGNHVVISNSLAQIKRVLDCLEGRSESMHDLEEYRFFRQRYRRDNPSETALVVVTDAAIRRWSGPVWRIGASRRTRARATLAELTMRHADELVAGGIEEPRLLETSLHGMPSVGEATVSRRGIHSKTYGSLDFQTPIIEMDLRMATKEEIHAYERWRNQYERRWRRAFDPIALRLSLTEDSVGADLSVIPLMIRSDYRRFINLVGEKRLGPGTGDPHPESLAEVSMALDTQSQTMQFLRMLLAGQGAGGDLLSWIDGSATVYFDHDEQWMKQFDKQSPWEMVPNDFWREVPVALFVPSKDNLRLAAFLVGARAFIDSAAPNIIRWETAKYGEFEYVIGSVAGEGGNLPHLYYVTTRRGLTLSSNAEVIKRVIDRHRIERSTDPEERLHPGGKRASAKAPQLVMKTSGRGVELMTRTNYRNGLREMNRLAWSNLPILNHLRSRYPGRDPHDVFQTLFRQKIVEPSGGKYVWNAERETYESTLQGYHLEPKIGPSLTSALAPDDTIEATVSFQEQGLRATLDVRSGGDQ